MTIVWVSRLHAQDLPGDVTSFIEQRTLCDHFRAEPWPEADTPEEQERKTFLARQMQYYCTGTDVRLRQLRERYRDNAEVLRRLSTFETSIEAVPH